MIAWNPARVRTALAVGLVFVIASLSASSVSAVAVCQKTSKSGKVSFKLREACRTEKGEVEVSLGTRTTVYHSFTDTQQPISGDDVLLAIDGGNTSLAFETTSESSDVVITFTAGCHVLDSTGGGWIDIELRLDGVAIAPSDLARNGFCFQTGANDEVEHTASYTVAVSDLAAGNHSVTAVGDNVSLTPSAFLGDVSLVVTVHEN